MCIGIKGILIMDYKLNIPKNGNTSFVPSRGENINFPVNTCFSDLSTTYLGYIRWHWHNEIEVIIINSGCADVLIDDNHVELKAGQALMINWNVLHSVHPSGNEKCTFYSLIFHPAVLFGYGQAYYSARYVTPIIDSSRLKYIRLDESVAWQKALIEHINNAIAADTTKKFGYELVTKAELCLFWSGLLEYYYTPEEIAPSSEFSLDSQRVKEALLYIEKHHMETITLDDIAASIHVSKSECCRCFKRTLKITPIEYVMKYRIFEATRKLRREESETMSISELAMSVGFNNASYFNKLFKKYLDCTPSQYKKFLRSKPANAQDGDPLSLHSPFEKSI